MKKIFILISIFIISLLAISVVSASEDCDSLTISDNDEIVNENPINEIPNELNSESDSGANNDLGSDIETNDEDANDAKPTEEISSDAQSKIDSNAGDISSNDADEDLVANKKSKTTLGMDGWEDWYEDYYYTHIDVNQNTELKKQYVTLSPKKVSAAYGASKYFQVKAINSKTKKAMPGVKLILKIYTGSKYKTATVTTNSRGIAKYNIAGLTAGTHKIVVSVKKSDYLSAKAKTGSAKITKVKAKISAKKVSASYGSGKYMQVKVINSKTKKAMSGVKVSIKAYTGKKYKTATVTTNSKGIAKYDASILSVGTHKIVANIKDKKSATAKAASSTAKISKATLKISAPKVTRYYNSTGKFQVTVKNKASGKTVKGVKVTIRVYTGSKYKTFTVKTNSKGIAAINTKTLAKGSHKVKVSIKNTSNFKKASASSIIKIKAKKKTEFYYSGARYTYTANGSPSTIYANITLYDEDGRKLKKTITAVLVNVDYEDEEHYCDEETYISGEEIAIRRGNSYTYNGWPPKSSYMLITFKGDGSYEGSTFKLSLT